MGEVDPVNMSPAPAAAPAPGTAEAGDSSALPPSMSFHAAAETLKGLKSWQAPSAFRVTAHVTAPGWVAGVGRCVVHPWLGSATCINYIMYVFSSHFCHSTTVPRAWLMRDAAPVLRS